MPTTSSDKVTKVVDHGILEERTEELGPYTVNFMTFREAVDMTGMLSSLPGGRCACPHWGQLLKGRVVVHYEDHDEVIEAGDAYYMAPGHIPEIGASTEFVMFSPTDELAATDAAIEAAMAG